MAGKLGRFQTVGFTAFRPGVTKSNHISVLHQSQPQMASNIMISLLDRRFGKSLESELAKYPTKEFDTDDE